MVCMLDTDPPAACTHAFPDSGERKLGTQRVGIAYYEENVDIG
jgi:hypothetical protein